jgi:AcrR family transcriptional regulator
MARIKSPEKRSAIIQAAVREIAEVGLGAPTAKIARRAGLAAGALFTYFANKEKLLNELYLELKIEVYRRVNTNFPRKANLSGGAARMVELSRLGHRIPGETQGFGAAKRIQSDHAGNADEGGGGARDNRCHLKRAETDWVGISSKQRWPQAIP